MPSLMTRGNLGRFDKDDVSMVVGTLETDIEYIKDKFNNSALKKMVKGLDLLALPKTSISKEAKNAEIQTLLIRQIVTYFVRHNFIFFHAPSDCVFADETMYNHWCLHRMSGKVVAIFNGRTREVSADNAVYLDIIRTKSGVKNFFMRNYSREWDAWRSDHPSHVAGARVGHAIFQEPDRAHIFCNMPSVSVGRFNENDLQHFVLEGTVASLDNDWLQLLVRQNRLLVQTNLDMGMSIEPDPVTVDNERGEKQAKLHKATRGWVTQSFESAKVGTLPDDSLRRRKFDDLLNMFCFSTNLN